MESTIHALWDCVAAQDIWASSVRKLQKGKHGQLDIVELMEDFMERLTGDEMELFWIQAWFIWNQRNILLHGGNMKHPNILNKRVEEYIASYKDAQNQLNVPLRQQSYGEVWRPPTSEEYKLNFDAAIFSDLGRTGYGAIIRNDKGEVMAAMTASGPMVFNSEEAELLACRRALEFAVDTDFSRLIIEGDNSRIMQAISSTVKNSSFFGNVVDDIRHVLRGLQWYFICCIKRGGNRVAHVLAQYARHNLVEDLYWIEESPPPALDALSFDLLSL